MKGRDTLTRAESAHIRDLLAAKAIADRARQKVLRAQIRSVGFYISDWAADHQGFVVSDFDDLIVRGLIKVSDEPRHSRPSQATVEVPAEPGNVAYPIPKGFDGAGLRAVGFEGFEPLRDCDQVREIDAAAGGTYVVLTEGLCAREFLPANPAGRFRGDPTVDSEALYANWVDEASAVYIGKGAHGRLRTRLVELLDFGAGGNRRHWGGRLIWQLSEECGLLLAWRTLDPRLDPLEHERRLLAAFRREYGKPPFANEPQRRGR